MSKKNQKVEEVKAETIANTIEAPKTYEEMQQMVAEYKKLQKAIKALPKEDREKLLPPVKAREIPESLIDLSTIIFEKVNFWESNLDSEFAKTVTTDKPDGNKSISLSSEDCKFTVAIIRKIKKEKK